jgi:hypothetical protein
MARGVFVECALHWDATVVGAFLGVAARVVVAALVGLAAVLRGVFAARALELDAQPVLTDLAGCAVAVGRTLVLDACVV